jgi:hypothetical protein
LRGEVRELVGHIVKITQICFFLRAKARHPTEKALASIRVTCEG